MIVAGIHVSNGGLPKRAVPSARVTREGLAGDRQRNKKYHGGPDRAVCLWSAEVLAELVREGHPLGPGLAGENLLLAEGAWGELAPGVELRFEGGLRLEIASYCAPCKNLVPYFLEGKYARISQKTCPGASRLYARVLSEGTVTTGERLTLHFSVS